MIQITLQTCKIYPWLVTQLGSQLNCSPVPGGGYALSSRPWIQDITFYSYIAPTIGATDQQWSKLLFKPTNTYPWSTCNLGTLIARFMGPTWGPSGADRTQVGLMMAPWHYDDAIIGAMASQINSLTIVYLTVHSGADQRNIKVPRHWPLCREFTGDRWIPRPNGQ